jgi:hypothetical protein
MYTVTIEWPGTKVRPIVTEHDTLDEATARHD